MKQKIYIAGKVTGLDPESVNKKFFEQEILLAQQGYDVINPIRLVESSGLQNDTWENIMRHCLAALVFCDAIYLLPDWHDSRGARVELSTALALQMEIQDSSRWIDLLHKKLVEWKTLDYKVIEYFDGKSLH